MRVGKRLLHTILAVILAYGTADALGYLLDIQGGRAQGPGWPLLFLLVLLCSRYAPKTHEKRAARAARVAAAVLSLCAVVGREISATLSLSGILGSFGSVLLFAWRVACLSWASSIPSALFFSRAGRCAPQPSVARPALSGWRLFTVIWISMLLCWLPYYLSFFPGSMSFDSTTQIEQALGSVPLSDAHPVMHTGLIALCVRIAALLGAPSACVALYSSLQMLCLSAAFACACVSLARWGAPRWMLWASWAFFAIPPVHPSLGMMLWKDVPHAAVTLLLVVQWLDCARDPNAFFASRKRLAALGTAFFFFATFRHNGFYVCLLSVPFFLWCFRAHWKRALPLCLAVAALLGVYRGPVLAALHPERGDVSEFLSIPAQHIARLVASQRAALSQDEQDTIRQVLPYDELAERYNPKLADPVKHALNEEAFRADPGRYASLWLRLVYRYPGALLESFLCNNYGYWYPESHFWVSNYFMEYNSVGAERHSIGIPDTQMFEWIRDFWSRMPGLSLFYSTGAMMWAVALAAALLAYKRRRDLLAPFLPLLLLWLSLLGSADFSGYRYAYGIIVCVPACMGAALVAQSDGPDKRL